MTYIVANDHTDYLHEAQPGDVCQICHCAFLAGEVVTAVYSGGTVGLHCADVEGCLERFHETTGAHADGRGLTFPRSNPVRAAWITARRFNFNNRHRRE